MTIRFVLGRSGSGKSRRCLDDIRQRLLEEPDGRPLIWLVPEQATFQAEHALVSTPGLKGLIRAQVLSFRRLAWRVMQETGDTARVPIGDTGKMMLLQRILHKRQEELRLFHASAEQIGFIERLHSLYSELKRYGVSAEGLDSHLLTLNPEHRDEAVTGTSRQRGNRGISSLLSDKLHDLSVVLRDYEEELARHYLDGEDYLAHLAARLGNCESVREAEVWVDGFFGFTPQEQAVVAACMKHCRGVTVSLCLDRPYVAGEKPHELDLFHPTAMTMVRLQEQIEEMGCGTAEVLMLDGEILPRFKESPMLAHLERNYDLRLSRRKALYPVEAQEEREPAGEGVKVAAAGIGIYAAVHRRAEVESAARHIVGLVRDGGLRWRDVAVRVRNIEEYGELLSTVFADYGIPCFFDQKRTVMHHPLIELIRSSLEVVRGRWRYDAVFRCVKTDFLLPLETEGANSPAIGRHAMDELENYVLAYGIQGSRWTDERFWRSKTSFSLEEAADAAVQSERSEDGLQAAESSGKAGGREEQALRNLLACRDAVVNPLARFEERIREAENARQMTEALYALLVEVHAPERLERWSEACIAGGLPEKAREHAQVWDSVIDIFDELDELMGGDELSVDWFAELVETGLENIRLGLVPPSLDQVLIGSIDRTRSAQVKASFVLGVSDGVLPKAMNEDGVLSENEREALLATGLPLAESSRRKLLDEQFLIYTVLCAPSHYLWLSYPMADEEGKSLLPSEVIKQVRSLFPGFKEKLLLGEPAAGMPEGEQLAFVAHPERALSHLLVQLKHAMRGVPIEGLWWNLYNWFIRQPEWRTRLSGLVGALYYTNEERPITLETSRLLYGSHLRASVSRMERFVACPFSQFVSYGLKLRERRIYRLEAPDIGQLFHAALSLLAKQLKQERLAWGLMSPEQLAERVDGIVDLLAPRLQGQILLSSSRYRYMTRKLKDVVGRASVVLAEHARRGAFEPAALELGFGPGEALPSYRIELDNGFSMELVGRIDRVDKAAGERETYVRIIDYKSSPTSLRMSEVYYGLSLQMLTYLDVVLTNAETWLGTEAQPGGVLYFHVHNPMIASSNALPPQAVEAEMRKRFKMRGLVLADLEAVRLMDGDLADKNGHSDLLPVAVKADGGFYKSASVATGEQWEQLRGHVRRVIGRIGTEITNGHCAVEPFRMGKKLACTFCSYKPVCQFDAGFEGNGFELLEERSKDDVWQAVGEAHAGHAGGTAASNVIVLPKRKGGEPIDND
ncbi:helicase-exonuclease AddAB subunit AddB [Paenibacillus sp. MBLB4367]|uniref:helicase-exonuclease AddAB subunit AddB n=1 Tax=Paenibacillus sp. MBLB4367 TaxID=3384767 RepID=UPI0039080AD2